MQEHGDVRAAERDGRPDGALAENQDRPEYRREFAEEHMEEYLAFVQAGQPGVLDAFVEHLWWKYRDWLN